MSPWQIAILVVVTLFVGLLIPSILQLRATLRAIETVATRTGSRLAVTLRNIELSSERIEHLTRGTEGGERQISELMQRLDEANEVLRRLCRTAQFASSVGAAVGPAVMAAIHAYQNARAGGSASAAGSSETDGEFSHPTNRKVRGEGNNGQRVE